MTPYDDGQVVAFVKDCLALTSDVGMIGVQCARMQFDVCNGMSYANSRAKHLAELGSHPNPNPAPVPTSGLESLSITGMTFGNGWQYRGATDFRLLKDILDGKDVSAVIKQRKDAGANIHRVLSMAGNIFQLDPDNYSDLDLSKAIQYVNGFGQRLELVALADCAQPLTKSLAWQQAHVARLGPILGMGNLEELGNEINNFYQNVNPNDFSKPSGCLSSRGSTTGWGNYCPLPPWDISTIHGDRDEKWLINIAKAGGDLVRGFSDATFPGGFYHGTQGPLVHNEPNKSPYPRTSPDDWFIAGVMCSVWRRDGIAGGTFHCDSGLQSRLWNDSELASAKKFYLGMDRGMN